MILRKLKNYAEWCFRLEHKIDDIAARLGVMDTYYTRSYSQHGEDVLIWNFMKKVLKIDFPTYIDIGAHHPYEISNTAIFHEHGCKGVNIEANPILIEEFYRVRPDDINIQCGCGGEKGILPFYMVDDKNGRNSFDKELVENFLNKEHSGMKIAKEIQIPIRTLQDIFENELNCIMPDYMSIDIEGLEYDVLSHFDLKKNGPKVMTVEMNDEKLKQYIENSGYFLYVKIYSNYTYVRKEFMETVYETRGTCK